jgi:hypothetical protein
MLARCENPKTRDFANYGGRGIRVCAEWHGFEAFFSDMGARPPKHSIERIDNEGDYEPGNCRWATKTEQSRNKRNNRWLDYKGERRLLVDWAKVLGFDNFGIQLLSNRLRRGWSVERAFSTPARKDHPAAKCPPKVMWTPPLTGAPGP